MAITISTFNWYLTLFTAQFTLGPHKISTQWMDLRHSVVIHSNCIDLLHSSDHYCFRLFSFHLHQIPSLTSSFISTDWCDFYATLLTKSSAFIEVTKCISNGTACVYATELLKDQLATDGCSQHMLQFIVHQCKWNDSLVHFFALSRWERHCTWFVYTFLFFWHSNAYATGEERRQSYLAEADEWKRWASKWSLSSVLQPSVSTIRRNFYRVPFLRACIVQICAQCKALYSAENGARHLHGMK